MSKKKLIGIIAGCIVAIFIVLAIAIPSEPTSPPSTTSPATEEPTPGKPSPLTTSEQNYATIIADQTTTVGQAFTELGALLQNPQYGNDEWTLKVATQLAIIRIVYDEAMQLDAPDSMAHIHLKYMQGMKHFNDMTYLLTQGIDNLDANLVEEAGREMDTGGQLIMEAADLMEEFKHAHGA